MFFLTPRFFFDDASRAGGCQDAPLSGGDPKVPNVRAAAETAGEPGHRTEDPELLGDVLHRRAEVGETDSQTGVPSAGAEELGRVRAPEPQCLPLQPVAVDI